MDNGERKYDLASDDENQYIIFRLNEISYGTPLLGVREIVKLQDYKEVPNTVPFFLGVMNLRGQIIGIIDLKLKFNMKDDFKGDYRLLVFETESGPLAAKVDLVDSVSIITPDNIDSKPPVASEIPLDFLIGIGKYEDQLINLLDLNKVLSKEELVSGIVSLRE